jgi:hypothetical protein
MRYLKTAVFAGGVAAISSTSLAQEGPPHFTDAQLMSICRAKRETVAKCECVLGTLKKVLPTEDVNLIFWMMYDNPPRARAWAATKRKAEPQWGKGLAQRGGVAMSSMLKNCDNVF